MFDPSAPPTSPAGQEKLLDLTTDRAAIVRNLMYVEPVYGGTLDESKLHTSLSKIEHLERLLDATLSSMNTPLFRRVMENMFHTIVEDESLIKKNGK